MASGDNGDSPSGYIGDGGDSLLSTASGDT